MTLKFKVGDKVKFSKDFLSRRDAGSISEMIQLSKLGIKYNSIGVVVLESERAPFVRMGAYCRRFKNDILTLAKDRQNHPLTNIFV